MLDNTGAILSVSASVPVIYHRSIDTRGNHIQVIAFGKKWPLYIS